MNLIQPSGKTWKSVSSLLDGRPKALRQLMQGERADELFVVGQDAATIVDRSRVPEADCTFSGFRGFPGNTRKSFDVRANAEQFQSLRKPSHTRNLVEMEHPAWRIKW